MSVTSFYVIKRDAYTVSGGSVNPPLRERARRLSRVRSLVVERRTAERAAGVRFPTCVPLARIQNRYGIPTGQFGSCPISIWRPGVLDIHPQAPKRSWRRG